MFLFVRVRKKIRVRNILTSDGTSIVPVTHRELHSESPDLSVFSAPLSYTEIGIKVFLSSPRLCYFHCWMLREPRNGTTVSLLEF